MPRLANTTTTRLTVGNHAAPRSRSAQNPIELRQRRARREGAASAAEARRYPGLLNLIVDHPWLELNSQEEENVSYRSKFRGCKMNSRVDPRARVSRQLKARRVRGFFVAPATCVQALLPTSST